MKYSILFPYFDRVSQLRKTLDSFIKFYRCRNDYEVILILDQKQTKEMTNILMYMLLDYRVDIKIRTTDCSAKVSFSPSTAYNDGCKVSKGEYIIVSNPECKHETDILFEMDYEFDRNPDVYVMCACRSLGREGEFERWYQHSIKRDVKYHFCSGISKNNFELIGGFDERYTIGYGYDDNSFRDSILRAGLEFNVRDDMIVSHQWHQKLRPMAYLELLKRNKDLYESESKILGRV